MSELSSSSQAAPVFTGATYLEKSTERPRELAGTLPPDLARFLSAQDGPTRRANLGNHGFPGWTLTLRFAATRTVDHIAARDDGLPIPTVVLSGPADHEPDLEIRRVADHAAEAVARAEYDRAKSLGLIPLDAIKTERFRSTLPKEEIPADQVRTGLGVLESLKAEGYPIRSQKVHRVALEVARQNVPLAHHLHVVADLEERIKDSDVAIGALESREQGVRAESAPTDELAAVQARLLAVADLARKLRLDGEGALDYVPGSNDLEKILDLLDGALQG